MDSQSCAEFVSLGVGRKFSQKENLCESSGMSRQVMKVSKGGFFMKMSEILPQCQSQRRSVSNLGIKNSERESQ